MAWDTKYWVGCDKHHPPGGLKSWEAFVAGTGKGRKSARYKKRMGLEEIERIEMSFNAEDLIWEDPDKERYFYVISSHVVGASLGEETHFVKVHWAVSGCVHGYPVTFDELYRELRKRNPAGLQRFLERAKDVPH